MVLRGRCLPYGEGIIYWPVVEVLKQLPVLPPDVTAAAAIRSLLGETGAPTSAEEIARAVRKTLEHASAERPLLVVFDDIQCGEETFLDLIEHVALLSSGAPILLLCIARPEFTDGRFGWPVTLRLEPLGEEDVEELIPERISGGLRAKIARAAGGNPLFIGEMLAMAGSAEGDTQVTPRLAALVRKELIRPDKPQLAGGLIATASSLVPLMQTHARSPGGRPGGYRQQDRGHSRVATCPGQSTCSAGLPSCCRTKTPLAWSS